MIEAIAAVFAILAVAGQAANVVLKLRILAGILESEGRIKDWVDERFVRRAS